MNTRPILVTGATGYIRGRLVLKLLEAGYRVSNPDFAGRISTYHLSKGCYDPGSWQRFL
jgi:UDP-glucose 4-epimerase